MLSRSGSAALVFVLLPVVSCDGVVEPPRVHHTSCDDAPGVTHSGSLGNAHWRAADGPHRLNGAVTFQMLEVEAGTLVCGAPGGSLTGRQLSAIGTAEAPITFAAEDPSQPWAGLVLAAGDYSSPVSRLEHVVIRDVGGRGLDAQEAVVRNARIENACAVSSPCSAVWASGYGAVVLEDVVVDGSGGAGISAGSRSGLQLDGVRIRNSAGIGLDIGPYSDPSRAVTLSVTGLRIVGGLSYPARVQSIDLDALAYGRAVVDSLLGNARDTLLVIASDDGPDSVTIYRDLPWRVERSLWGNPPTVGIPSLRLEPGAMLTFDHAEIVWQLSDLEARGTATEPITIRGGNLFWRPGAEAATDTIRLAHVLLEDMAVGRGWLSPGSATLEMDSIVASDTYFDLAGGTSSIRTAALTNSQIRIRQPGVELEDLAMAFPGDVLPGAGTSALHVESGSVALAGCDIRGAPADAVLVSAAADEDTSITGCNLVDNAGFGVNNLSAFTVDAAGNWWGDPAGPDGPDGDGVSGDVVVEPVRTEPVQR